MPDSQNLTLYLGRHEFTRSGMWVYSRSLLEALMQEELPWHVSCLAGGSQAVLEEMEQLEQAYQDKLTFSALPGEGLSRRFALFGDILRQVRADIVHGTSNVLPFRTSGKRILTLHDLLQAYPVSNQQSPYQKLRSLFYKIYFKRIVKTIDLILTDLPQTALEIEKKLKPACPVRVIYPGLDAVYLQGDTVGTQHGNTVLGFASRDRRKNALRLIEAFSLLKRKDARLLVVIPSASLQPSLEQEAARHGVLKQIEFRCGVEQKDMPVLYRSARVVAFPSLAEGFGYPIYEALSQGVPAVCAQGLLLPEFEQLQQTFCFACDPLSVDSIQRAISNALTQDLAATQRVAVQQQVRELLSFRNTARQLLSAYSQCPG